MRAVLTLVGRLAALPLRALVYLYQRLVSPLLPGACRYHPTCSAYADEALRVHGGLRGSWLSVRRLSRCHPWGPGGVDPVPPPVAVDGPAAGPLSPHSSRRT